MARQFVVTLPGKGTSDTSEDTEEAAAMVLNSDDDRTTAEVVAQLDTLKPGDTIFLSSGTLIDVVGVLDTTEPIPTKDHEQADHRHDSELQKLEEDYNFQPSATGKPKP